VRRADNLTTFISLKLLEPTGPVQACNGLALPFTCFGFLGHLREYHLVPWTKTPKPVTTAVTLCTTGFNIQKFYIVTQCIYVFYMDLGKTTDFCLIQQWHVVFYN